MRAAGRVGESTPNAVPIYIRPSPIEVGVRGIIASAVILGVYGLGIIAG